MKKKLREEIDSFQGLWSGGFCRSKMGWNATVLQEQRSGTLDLLGLVDKCIAPYIIPNETLALEIGTDGGFWAAKIAEFDPKAIIGADIRPDSETNFSRNIRNWSSTKDRLDRLYYLWMDDFTLSALPDDTVDYVFSFDVFCHISFTGTKEYLKNLYPKLKTGANLFIMIADGDKYTDERGRRKCIEGNVRCPGMYEDWEVVKADYDGDPSPGRWYFYGLERFVSAARSYGYTIIEEDACKTICKYSPVVHLRKEAVGG